MTGWTLTLRQAPALRLDLRTLAPTAFAALPESDAAHVPVVHGNATTPLGEWFTLAPRSDGRVVLQGDLSRADRIGWRMDGGELHVEGPAGHHTGTGLRAGLLQVHGSVGHLAGAEMAGGTLRIDGDAGDFGASALPGSLDGMRGGLLEVRGSVGQRFADRMRRGTVLIHGNAGDFLASRMVAGTLAIAGAAGAHAAWGMRRGTVIFGGPAPVIGPTFVPSAVDTPVFWQLLARDLQRHGGPFAGLAGRTVQRQRGDLACGGQGELLLPR